MLSQTATVYSPIMQALYMPDAAGTYNAKSFAGIIGLSLAYICCQK